MARVREDGDVIVAEIERIGRRRLRCSGCGDVAQQTAGQRPRRRWRDLRLRDRPLVLAYAPYRVRCRRCGVRVEQVPWAARWARVTTALARAVALLARRLSWAEVATHFGLDWKTAVAIVREAVATGLELRRWRPLHVIGIDEVSRAKGQTYLTLVYDLARHGLLWAGEGRTRDTIEAFFRWLGRHRGRAVRVVCCDMWDPLRRGGPDAPPPRRDCLRPLPHRPAPQRRPRHRAPRSLARHERSGASHLQAHALPVAEESVEP